MLYFCKKTTNKQNQNTTTPPTYSTYLGFFSDIFG